MQAFETIVSSATVSVADLTYGIKRHLADFGSGWVEGEIQRVNRATSGHVYLTLADERATIDVTIWKGQAAKMGELPPVGALVQAHYEKVDFYAKGGKLSINVDEIKLTGDGELLARKQQALDRLNADGLTDPERRRALPRFPRVVAVISGRDSDAKADVEKALSERFPAVRIVHRAALVQGTGAVGSIIDALAHLQDQPAVDVIILARGGGSVQDLHPFDDERLCRAIFACAVPVVTSIGHTQQRPNCDHVAAACADVPAKTAALVVPSTAELLAGLDHAELAIRRAHAGLSRRVEQVEQLALRVRGSERLAQLDATLAGLGTRLLLSGRHAVATARMKLDRASALLDAKDFRRHGFALITDHAGGSVRSVAALSSGDELTLTFNDGAARVTVTNIEESK